MLQCSALSERDQRLSLRPVRGLLSISGPTAIYASTTIAMLPKIATAPAGDIHFSLRINQVSPGLLINTPCSGD
ncbi:Uncharacterised protein [Vibrio cholerae]|nr:Uncharacterised protein [Vibrio cholerae]CSC62160.1 Uncharacterised protein [Vibrio cholerae]